MEIESEHFTVPGTILGGVSTFESGVGTYILNGNIISSLLGRVVIEDNSDSESIMKRINVISPKNQTELVLAVGDRLLCRVLRLAVNQAHVEILSVGDKELRQLSKGVIRKEDVRLSEIDSVILHECFRPGDIVRAAVISLGDSRQYFLSTAEVDLGVFLAKSQESGSIMVPISWKEMEDPISKTRESRKVARPT